MVKFFGNNSNIFWLIEALFIAILCSTFIYIEWLGFTFPLLNTLLGVMGLWMLLKSRGKVWSMSGFLIALFWFWWIALSFRYYGFAWAMPLGMITVASIYGGIFWLFIKIAYYIEKQWKVDTLFLKALFILLFSSIHPFGFDWLKFELIFIDSYFGIEKWQFSMILLAIVCFIKNKCQGYSQKISLILLFLAMDLNISKSSSIDSGIKLVTTYVNIDDKWKPEFEVQQMTNVYTYIEKAMDQNYSIVVLPESVIPKFINKYEDIKDRLKRYSNDITIVIGGLYLDDDGTPRNSTYIFSKDQMQIANKVVLVPFGEANPLPEFLSNWVNKIFYHGAVDYKPSREIYDYKINNTTYRNAICFEATSEKLYKNPPQYMIAISNNGWFTPSIEPTLQKLLLKYYSKKYSITIYHSINASESYTIESGKVLRPYSP